MPTIRDVAREAGVSVSTVSRVIMANPNVNNGTRERVLEVIERLAYRPSAIARGLVSKRTKTLGVVVSDISNPFYPQMIKGIEDVANERGYTIILCNTDDELPRNARVMQVLNEQRVDGTILASVRRDDPSLEQLLESDTPAVLVNRGLPGNRISQVVLNNRFGAEMATNHLIELGRRRIVHLAGPAFAQNARERASGFQRAAAAAGIPPEAATILEVGFHPVAAGNDVHDAIRHVLTSDPSPNGLLAVNDILALHAMEIAVFELGLRVPEDLAIVGFDDSHLVASRFVQITTISHRPYEMGVKAAELLLGRIEGEQKTWPKKIVLEPRLIVRASTVGVAKPSSLERVDAS